MIEFDLLDGRKMYVGAIPGRKRAVVARQDGSTFRALAECKSDEDAEQLIELLKEIAVRRVRYEGG